MKRNHKNPDGVHAPYSQYSHVVEVINPNQFIFCSGQVPALPDGRLVAPNDFMSQGEQVIKNLQTVLADSNAELSDIVKLTTYLTQEQYVEQTRELFAKYFPQKPPTNAMCIVKSLTHQDILIEIEAIAVL